MERARPNPRERDRKSPRKRWWALGGCAAALLLTGCDSVSGVPDDGSRPAGTSVASTPPAALPSATPATSTAPAPPADAPPVGAVPGVPAAVPALQRWAADLRSGADLEAACWTMAPQNVADMYGNPQAVLTALAQPGVATAETITWSSRTTRVVADAQEVATGYACPRVYPAGAETGYNDADARHTVRRYLARFVGAPLDPADREGTYPLVCKASPAAWDPTGSGRPIPAPLANNPGKLTGTTTFAGQEIRSERARGDYLTVYVPVTNSSGVTQTRTFTLTETAEGYCIGDVSP